MSNINIELDKSDLLELIDKAIEKKDRSVSIYVSKYGTNVNIAPYEETPDTWQPIAGSSKVLCPNCGRAEDAAYPFCRWCGNENGLNKKDMAEAVGAEERRRRHLRTVNKVLRSDVKEDEVTTDDQT